MPKKEAKISHIFGGVPPLENGRKSAEIKAKTGNKASGYPSIFTSRNEVKKLRKKGVIGPNDEH